MHNLTIYAGKIEINGAGSLVLACELAREVARQTPGVEHRVMRGDVKEASYTLVGSKLKAWVR